MKECHDLSSEKTRVRGGQTTLMYDKISSYKSDVETPQYQFDQERSEQNKITFIIKVSGRDGLERIIPTPAESEVKLSR
jgi:hypothetical protein